MCNLRGPKNAEFRSNCLPLKPLNSACSAGFDVAFSVMGKEAGDTSRQIWFDLGEFHNKPNMIVWIINNDEL